MRLHSLTFLCVTPRHHYCVHLIHLLCSHRCWVWGGIGYAQMRSYVDSVKVPTKKRAGVLLETELVCGGCSFPSMRIVKAEETLKCYV